MAESQRPIGAVAIAKTTYHLIWRMAIPALVLMAVPFMASFLVALIAFGDPNIGFVKKVFLGFVQFLANVIFAAALLRHILQNAPASVHVLQMGRVEWHMLAISVAVVLLMIPISYLSVYAAEFIFMLMDTFEMQLGSKWIAYGLMAMYPLAFIYPAVRFLIAGPLILQRGDDFVRALARSWAVTRRQAGGLILAFVFVMVPFETVSVIGMLAEDYLLHGQSKVILAFVRVVQEYILMTALTILSAVVFQGLSPTVEPVRTP